MIGSWLMLRVASNIAGTAGTYRRTDGWMCGCMGRCMRGGLLQRSRPRCQQRDSVRPIAHHVSACQVPGTRYHLRSLEDAGLVDRLDDLNLVEQLVVLRDARVVQQKRQHVKWRRRDGGAGADHAPKCPGNARAPELEAFAVLNHAPINLHQGEKNAVESKRARTQAHISQGEKKKYGACTKLRYASQSEAPRGSPK